MSNPDDPFPLSRPERLSPLPDNAEVARRLRVFTRSRRITAAAVGFLMGVVFVGVAEIVNPILLPGLPLYTPPPGLPWSSLIGGLIGLAIGLIAAWTSTPPLGIFLASLAGALVVNGYNIYRSPRFDASLLSLFAVLLAVVPPLTALIAAAIIFFRWALDRQQSAVQDRRSLITRAGVPILLVLLSAAIGWTQQYPPDGRTVLQRMHTLVESGLAAQDDASLPPELAPGELDGFRQNAGSAYSLQWDRDPYNQYQIPRPGDTQGRESLGIARFSNGWMLICLYPRPDWQPRCVGRWTVQAAPAALHHPTQRVADTPPDLGPHPLRALVVLQPDVVDVE